MKCLKFSILKINYILPLLVLTCLLGGCTASKDTIGWGAGIGGMALLAHSPNNEIEQIYYLGVFDPQEQVPPTVYRVRVHGQASAMSLMKFASGWVPADMIDSLGTSLSFEKDSGVLDIQGGDKWSGALPTKRKLVMFGPEGFRQAPKNHRLVIMMGSNPEEFFKAIDMSLGMVSETKVRQHSAELQHDVVKALLEIRKERQRLDDLDRIPDAASNE